VEVKLPGPVQLYVTPLVVEEPFSVIEEVVQVSDPETVAVAPGEVMFCWTFTVAEDTQPFTGLVTVNV
jgi:hypothetical protein